MVFSGYRTKLFFATLFLIFVAASGSYADSLLHQQKERLKNWAVETRDKSARERREIHEARRQLFKLYQDYDLNERKAKSYIEKIESSQFSLLNIHLQSQDELRDILNREQFAEFQRKFKREHGPIADMLPPSGRIAPDDLPDITLLGRANIPDSKQRKLRSIIGPTSEKKKIVDNLRRNTKRLLDIYEDYSLDRSAAKRLISEIHSAQVKLLNLNLEKQKSIREVLSEDEFSRLRSEISNMIKQKARGKRR